MQVWIDSFIMFAAALAPAAVTLALIGFAVKRTPEDQS